jgi:hypothetical protein
MQFVMAATLPPIHAGAAIGNHEKGRPKAACADATTASRQSRDQKL